MQAWVEVWVLAGALAVDAAAANAVLATRAGVGWRVLSSLLFGAFQAGMSGVGAVAGDWLVAHAAAWDHWVAFVLLAGLGGRMMWPGDDDAPPGVGLWPVLVLAVATSIDALAAGVTLPLFSLPTWAMLAVIGGVTVAASAVAAWAGRAAGASVGPAAERVGGLVLIAIGLRILVEHLIRGV